MAKAKPKKNATRFNQDIVALCAKNTDFRREIYTDENAQIVIMSIEPGDDIGEETHEVDQILFFTDGEGHAVLDGAKSKVKPNSLVLVPAGTKHNFINDGAGKVPLKLFTVYAPPEEEPGTVHKTKEEAEKAEEEEDK